MINNTEKAFLELVKAGLWEKEARLLQFDRIDFDEILKIAEEQSVVGLVAAGIEHIVDVNVPQKAVWQFIGQTLQLEQRNNAMNSFIAHLFDKMRLADIYALLVKGQGVAQCYERPMWRTSGDIDLLLSSPNYIKAKNYLSPLATNIQEENEVVMHLGMTVNQWTVELHGTLRSCCLKRMDKVIDEAQNDVFYGGSVRSWNNGNTQVFLPSPDNNVIFVFTHILKHFYHGGIGLRQICDWCRLLWTYRDSLNHTLLESRIRGAGLMTEWKAFAALAVEYLGMPVEAMPFYLQKKCCHRKAEMIMDYVLDVGNFGNKRDRSYYSKKSRIEAKLLSLRLHTLDFFHHIFVFPMDTTKVWLRILLNGTVAVITGKDNGIK